MRLNAHRWVGDKLRAKKKVTTLPSSKQFFAVNAVVGTVADEYERQKYRSQAFSGFFTEILWGDWDAADWSPKSLQPS
jgi:hypothetical protein